MTSGRCPTNCHGCLVQRNRKARRLSVIKLIASGATPELAEDLARWCSDCQRHELRRRVALEATP